MWRESTSLLSDFTAGLLCNPVHKIQYNGRNSYCSHESHCMPFIVDYTFNERYEENEANQKKQARNGPRLSGPGLAYCFGGQYP